MPSLCICSSSTCSRLGSAHRIRPMGASSPGWRKTGGLAGFGAVAGLQNGSSSIVVTVSRQTRAGQMSGRCAGVRPRSNTAGSALHSPHRPGAGGCWQSGCAVRRAGSQKARAPRCVLSRSCGLPVQVAGFGVKAQHGDVAPGVALFAGVAWVCSAEFLLSCPSQAAFATGHAR